jgi:lysophospholipid acyltransferase 5
MAIVLLLSGVLGLPEPAARYLSGLILTIFIGLMYRPLIATRSSYVQSIFNAVAGIGVMYYVFGVAIWHSLLDVVTVYVILTLVGANIVSVSLTWLFTMGHMVGGYIYMFQSHQVHPIAWTIPHSVLVLKLIGLAYDAYDGQKDKMTLSDEQKERCLPQIPSFIDFLGFSYFFGNVMAGPQMNFSRYHQFITQSLIKVQPNTSCLTAGIHRLCLAIFTSAVYSTANKLYPLNYVLTDEYNDMSFILKIAIMLYIGKMAVWRYITVWLFAESACIFTGITYNTKKKDGEQDWKGIMNVDFLHNEFSITLQGTIESFNIQTNRWISMYVFKRLKWIGNKNVSHFLSLIFVSIWHGVWPGYFICFSFEFISVLAERQVIKASKCFIDLSTLPLPLYCIVWTCLYLVKSILIAYPLLSFMLLSWSSCWKFMTSVYFIGHIATVIAWIMFGFITPKDNFKKQSELYAQAS